MKSLLMLLTLSFITNTASAYMMSGVEVNKSYVWVLYKNYATAPGAPADIVCEVELELTNDVRGIKKDGRKAKCSDILFKDVAAMVSPKNNPNIDMANFFNGLAKSTNKWTEIDPNDPETISCRLRFDISKDSNPLQNLCAFTSKQTYEGTDSSVK